MKNSFCLLPTVYCLFVLISSCKPKINYTKEISQLDSAKTVLTEAEKYLVAVDTSSLRTQYNSIASDLHLIMEKISKDTVKKKTAIVLTEGYKHTGNILNLISTDKFMEQAIFESKQRISDLQHDLNESLIEKSKSSEYVVKEINTSGKIYDLVTSAIEKAKTSSLKLDSLKPEINFLTDGLKSK